MIDISYLIFFTLIHYVEYTKLRHIDRRAFFMKEILKINNIKKTYQAKNGEIIALSRN